MHVAGFQQSFDTFQGMMAPMAASKTVTVVRKRNVEDRLQHVQQSGLHHSITYRRDVGSILHLLQLALGIVDKKIIVT